MAIGLQPTQSVWDAPGPGGLPPMGVQLSQATADQSQAMNQYDKAAAEKSSIDAQGADKLAALDTQQPKAPDLTAPSDFKPKPIDHEQMQQAMQSMFALAAIGGAMTRHPMTAALNAFSAGLKGLHDGDVENYKRQQAEFSQNFKVAIEKTNQAVQQYQMAMEKHKGDRQAMLDEINLRATAANDTMTAALARSGQDKQIIMTLQAMAKTTEQNQRWLETFQQHDQQFTQRMEMEGARLAESRRGHDRTAGAAGAANDPQLIKLLADRWRTGDSSALTGLGYGAASAGLRKAVLTQAAKDAAAEGQSGADLAGQKASYQADASSLKTYQNYVNRLEGLGNKIDKDITTLFTVAEKGVGPTQIPAFDKWLQMGRKGTGDPDVSAFETQIQTIKNEYGRSMAGPASNAQLSKSAMDHADDVINSAQTLDQLKANIKMIRQDIKNQRDSAHDQISEIKNRLSNKKTTEDKSGGDGALSPEEQSELERLRAKYGK